MYKIGEWAKARKDFYRVFGVNIAPFYYGLLTVLSKKICIDIFLFDDYLHQIHGEYEEQGISMEKLIEQKYGNEAVEIFNKLI